jgi:Domain of unknown function (DUF4397)
MHSFHRWLAMLALALLAACDGDDRYYPGYQGPAPGTYANLQIVNTSYDSPPMDVLLDGATLIQHLDYGQGTGELSIPLGSHTMVVQIETPGSPTPVSTTTLDAAANMDYVLAVEGLIGGVQPPALTTVVFPHQLAVVPGQSAQVQVLNAGGINGAVTVYITAPGADLATSTPLGTAPAMGAIGPTQVMAGESEIRVTSSSGGVIYDSGTITLPGGTDLVLSLVAGTLPIPMGLLPPAGYGSQMAVVDAFGNNSWLPPYGAGADLRVVNNSPNLSALTVIANNNTVTPVVSSLGYATATAYLSQPSGLATFTLASSSNLSDTLASGYLTLNADTLHTLYSFGPFPQIIPFVTHDDYRRYSTQARVRFIQGSPTANVVDVYLTASGTGIASATPLYSALPFMADTGFVSYAAGAYDLTVTAAGSKTPIIGPVALTATNGGIYTGVASDAPTGGTPLGLIELDDF